MEVVCNIALKDSQVYQHLLPIANHHSVSKLWIIRNSRINLKIPKAEYIIIPMRFKVLRLILMFIATIKLAHRNEVKLFVSFNPIPYGLISLIAARMNKKAIHLGFIGSDWYIKTKGIFGRLLIAFYRKANLITATGKTMKEDMITTGLDTNRITILPHTIDVDHFPISNVGKAKYDCIFVGSLIGLKQVDLIIKAFASVCHTHPNAKLCIAGDGPMRPSLKKLVKKLKIDESVDFVGYVDNVQPFMSMAKMIIIASRSEGLPFVLIEGICSGLVPICTPVGTIPEIIKNGKNGLIFPTKDANALAEHIKCLLEQPSKYKELRTEALKLRNSFSHNSAMAVWDQFFNNLSDN